MTGSKVTTTLLLLAFTFMNTYVPSVQILFSVGEFLSFKLLHSYRMMNSIIVLFPGIAVESILGSRLWEKWRHHDLCICKDVLSSKCSVHYRQLSA